MKLAVFTSRYPGKVSTFFERDMLALQRAGVEVHVFPLQPYDADLWRYSIIARRDSIPRERVHDIALRGARPGHGLAGLAAALPDAAALATSALRYGPMPVAKSLYAAAKGLAWAARYREPFDHVLAYWGSYPGTAAYVYHRLVSPQVPFSIWVHAGSDLYFRPVYLREKLSYADRIITCCEFNRGYIRQQFPDIADRLDARIHVSYHGLDLEGFAYEPEGRPAARLLGVGRLAHDKGFDFLIRAVAALVGRGHEVELELVGDGPEESRLRALVDKLQIPGHVRFRGWLPFAEVRAAMTGATVLVHPSTGLGDALPNVLREAMALGTPVIASDVAGIPEALDRGRAGVLVPPRDLDALTEAIARVLGDAAERRRMAAAGRCRTEELSDMWRNGARLAEVLRATRRGSPQPVPA